MVVDWPAGTVPCWLSVLDRLLDIEVGTGSRAGSWLALSKIYFTRSETDDVGWTYAVIVDVVVVEGLETTILG